VIPAAEALERLREGNRRFASDASALAGTGFRTRRLETAPNQEPFAVILGCADSRVPAEIVFDQGLGDLFVIRVAGNIVAPSQIGSVEFAAARTGARLVVVLGHSRCGAILATLEEMGRPSTDQSRGLRSIVERIQPAIEPIVRSQITPTDDALIRRAVRANVKASVQQLYRGSGILERLIQTDGLMIVGAEYCLETGTVEFFDGI
jgi:carbonic anhydrase